MKTSARHDRLTLLAAVMRASSSPAATLGTIATVAVLASIGIHVVIPSALAASHPHGASKTVVARGLAIGLTALASLLATFAAPIVVTTQIVRDRASGAADLALEAERSPGRRLAAYVIGPSWPATLIMAVSFVAMAPSACDQHLGGWAWLGLGLAALALQALSSLLAATLALAMPRSKMLPQMQGIGVVVPLTLIAVALLLGLWVAPDAWPLAAAILLAGAVPFWWVARSLVERPERPLHLPHGALAILFTGLGLAATAWAFPSHGTPLVGLFAPWAALVAWCTASWTLPRAERLALAIRRGAGDHATRALATAASVSALFGAGALLWPSAALPVGTRAFVETAALVVALSVTLTTAELLVKAAPPARRRDVRGLLLFAGFVAPFAEVIAIESPSSAVARLDPFTCLRVEGDLADGHAARLAILVSITAAMAFIARAAWRRAVRRLTLADAGG